MPNEFSNDVTAFMVGVVDAELSVMLQFRHQPHGSPGVEHQVTGPLLQLPLTLAEELLARLQVHIDELRRLQSTAGPPTLQ